jgi:hypothetical protein
MEECLETHEECKQAFSTTSAPFFPKRTISVGPNNNNIKLVENRDSTTDQYTCLSHCWGTQQSLKTTKSSLVSHLDSLPYNGLPKTFQNAIDLTRRMGIRHIWIDSLCIVQDDENDWATEASKMHLTYSNAYFTIAAADAVDCRGGCYRNFKPVEFTVLSTKLFVKNELQPADVPLFDRRWVYQEQYLSIRTIYFTRYELAWECETKLDHEWRVGLPGPLPHWHKRLDGDAGWEGVIVPGYTARKLSYRSDKLPALSGIARQYADSQHD